MNASDNRAARGKVGSRRLHSVILVAAHRACDSGNFDIAGRLLQIDEELIAVETDPRQRRRGAVDLVAAHERLWYLRKGTTK